MLTRSTPSSVLIMNYSLEVTFLTKTFDFPPEQVTITRQIVTQKGKANPSVCCLWCPPWKAWWSLVVAKGTAYGPHARGAVKHTENSICRQGGTGKKYLSPRGSGRAVEVEHLSDKASTGSCSVRPLAARSARSHRRMRDSVGALLGRWRENGGRVRAHPLLRLADQFRRCGVHEIAHGAGMDYK